jgi:hypothetical protein
MEGASRVSFALSHQGSSRAAQTRRGTSQLQVARLDREERPIAIARSFGVLRQPQDDSTVSRARRCFAAP